jgi:ATP-dependent Lon protease
LTLSGRILPVGGIREKILAAQRSGVRIVVFPEPNRIDIEGIEEELRKGVEVVLARDVASVAEVVLV